MIDQLLKATRDEDWHQASALLYKHWSDCCPVTYSPNVNDPWDSVIDETEISNELIYPLAAMFCGEDISADNDTKDVSLSQLNKLTGVDAAVLKLGKICGRVFKNGEPTYICKECATDATCVMCHECFINSEHKSHKYKMHTSLGSGYCDCGDPEAWTKDFACRLHFANDQTEKMKKTSIQLPKELESRVYFSSLIAVKFAVNVLCCQENADLSSFVQFDETDGTYYQAVLYNDETHTYDAVIRALELSVHCTTNQGMRLATIVDREGRAIVRTATREICNNVKNVIERRTMKETNRRTQKSGPLGVKVLHSSIVSYQNFAVRLLSWLSSKVQEFAFLGEIIGRVLLYTCEDEECGCKFLMGHSNDEFDKIGLSYCLQLMLEDKKLWKSARASFHQIIMSTVLMNIEQKQDFGRLFVRNYAKLFEEYIDDDHEHSVSVVSMSVQVFTVATVARYLIIKEDVLKIIMTCLYDFCSQRYVSNSIYNTNLHHFDFSVHPNSAILRRAMHMFSDFSYLLSVSPKPDEWTDVLRRNFSRGGIAFLRFLRYVEGMDEVKRQAVEHQITESEWETAFNIFINMQDCLSLLLIWATADPIVHMNLFRKCLSEIAGKVRHMQEFREPRVKMEVNSKSASCIKFEVSKQPLSIHHPLWRFTAALFNASPDILANYYVEPLTPTHSDESEHEHHAVWLTKIRDLATVECAETFQSTTLSSKFNLFGYRTMLMDIPLRVLVLQAQSYAQLWRRNGFSLVNQVYNYSSHLCRTQMFDKDILMLQICAALMDSDKYLIRVIDRFDLTRWARIGFENTSFPVFSSDTPATPSTTLEELSKISTLLAEEMFHLIIMVIGERFSLGVSECTPMDILQREIIHFLCTGPKPFSQIEKVVPHESALNRLSLYDAVNMVAVFQKPTLNTPGNFLLKKELLGEYNQLFYHYSKSHLSQAEQYQKKMRTDESFDLIACPPPKLPNFMPFYRPILRLMETTTFINLLRVVFERIDKRSRFASEGLFQRALFLTAMALNEQQRAIDEAADFGFWQQAKKANIFEILQSLENRPEVEAHVHLLQWVLQRYKLINNAINNKDVKVAKDTSDATNTIEEKNAKRANMGAKKRQMALERMKKLQNAFKTQSLDNTMDAVEEPGSSTGSLNNDFYDEDCEQGIVSLSAGFPVCCGPNKTKIERVRERKVTCILCQESEILSHSGKAIVCSGFIQNSCLFSVGKYEVKDLFDIFAPIDLNMGTSITTCSHTMHFNCYKNFLQNLTTRERRASQRLANAESGEYMCPLCKRLSCTTLPLLPVNESLPEIAGFSTLSQNPSSTFKSWLEQINVYFTELRAKKSKKHARKRPHSKSVSQKSSGSGENSLSLSSSQGSSSAEDPQHEELDAEIVQHRSDSMSSTSTSTAIDEELDQLFDAEVNEENTNPTGISRFLQNIFSVRLFPNASPQDLYKPNVPKSFKQWHAVSFFLNDLFKGIKLVRSSDNSLRNFGETVIVLKACAFLLRSIHSILEVEEKPLFGALNTRHKDCLSAMVRLATVVPFNIQASGIRSFIMNLLDPLLSINFKFPSTLQGFSSFESTNEQLSVPTSGSSKGRSASTSSIKKFSHKYRRSIITQIDMLTYAIQLITCIGWANSSTKTSGAKHFVADGSIEELHVIRLTFLAYIFQVFVSYDDDKMRDEETKLFEKAQMPGFSRSFDAPLSNELRNIEHLYTKFVRPGIPLQNVNLLYKKIFDAAVNFLRPLALFYNALTLIPPPEALKDPSLHGLEALCRYLGLPPRLYDIMHGSEVDSLFQLWSQDYVNEPPQNIEVPLKIKLLINLPRDYSDLINLAADFKCPSIKADNVTSTAPTLCLTCGELICSQSYCCQRMLNNVNVGACTYHMSKCAVSCGIFLRIRDCQVILLMARQSSTIVGGCHKAAPYVDEFGETDQGMRRGYPMQLSPQMYAKFQRFWIHQEVAEEIQNQHDINYRNMAFEWRHF